MLIDCVTCKKPFEWSRTGPGAAPITCSYECRRKRRNQQNKRYRAEAPECPPDKHGTSAGYTHYLCDCSLCSKWAREYKQEWRRRRAGAPTEEKVAHGK